MTDTIKGLKSLGEAFDRKAEAPKSEVRKWKEGVTIAKVPDWMELKPEMMRHLIREHEKLGRTLTEEETVTLLRTVGFEIIEGK